MQKNKRKKTEVHQEDTLDIRKVLKESTDLSDDSLDAIEEAFKSAVNQRAQLHVKKALLEQDEEYTNKLNELLEAIDVDRTKKTKIMLEALDKNRTHKLKKVIDKYNRVIQEDAVQYKDSLVTTISKYLDKFLLEHVPVSDIKAAVKNKKATKLISQLREHLMVDRATSVKSIREGILEGKQELTKYSTEAQKAKKQAKMLQEKVARMESEMLLERKTADLPDDVKSYVTKMLSNKDVKFISENFDYTVNMFDQTEENRLETLKEEAIKTRQVKEEPRTQNKVIEEKNEPQLTAPTAAYLGELQKY